MITHISKILHQKGSTTFRTFLKGARSRLEIVVTFLAMLELIKLRFIQVNQENNFGDIKIETLSDWDDEEDIELEFGE
jgi:segregation and condensation protein A